MNLWLLNHDAVPPEQPGGTRHYDFARGLAKRGHDVTIFASSFHYLQHTETRSYGAVPYQLEDIGGVRFAWIRTRAYHRNSVDRLLNMLDYTQKVIRHARHMALPKPDVIVGSSVHLFAVYAAYRVARHLRVPFVMEVRDIWPQTLIDLGFSKWHPLILLLAWLEHFLYRRACCVISLLPGGVDHVASHGVPRERIHWIPNGVDMTRFRDDVTVPHVEPFTLSYAGAVGEANSLGTLVDAAEILRNDPAFCFRILGDGPEKEALCRRAAEKHLPNLEFLDPVPKDRVPPFLVASSALYFHLRDCPVFRFGISSNKLFDYMASGRPIIFAASALNNPVAESKGGLSIEPEDAQALVRALRELRDLDGARLKSMGEAARSYVATHHDMGKLVDLFEAVVMASRQPGH